MDCKSPEVFEMFAKWFAPVDITSLETPLYCSPPRVLNGTPVKFKVPLAVPTVVVVIEPNKVTILPIFVYVPFELYAVKLPDAALATGVQLPSS